MVRSNGRVRRAGGVLSEAWGISSAGRAPALQAGGRRFDPVILHQQEFINTKDALQEASLLLIEISRSIGCSLKIHRVESALLMETAHS